MADIIIRTATKEDVNLINKLANKIWPVTYSAILSEEQLQYMMNLIYSESSLQKQFDEGHNFLIAEKDNNSVAFADYSLLKDNIYKLHKIYVLPNQQGKGIGKILIDYVINVVEKNKGIALVLNVNRNNKAKQVYEHLGFKIISEEDIDIGNGFFMNDYIMEKKI